MDIYNALAEPTRRTIIEMIARKGQLSASDIYEKFDVSHPAISQHLKVLRVSNLVLVQKKAQQRIYTINPQPLLEMEDWIKKMTTLWNDRFDALDAVLQAEKRKLFPPKADQPLAEKIINSKHK